MMNGGVCVFKQKTAYEVRISDWSSDVCSSDLADRGCEGRNVIKAAKRFQHDFPISLAHHDTAGETTKLFSINLDRNRWLFFANIARFSISWVDRKSVV